VTRQDCPIVKNCPLKDGATSASSHKPRHGLFDLSRGCVKAIENGISSCIVCRNQKGTAKAKANPRPCHFECWFRKNRSRNLELMHELLPIQRRPAFGVPTVAEGA
jgi:hypothetical protein